FRVTFVCGKNKKPETCALEAEAGKGGEDGESNNFCLLHCLSEGARERRKAKSKEEGTRRAVDRRPVPAPAATPNTKPQSPPWQWRGPPRLWHRPTPSGSGRRRWNSSAD